MFGFGKGKRLKKWKGLLAAAAAAALLLTACGGASGTAQAPAQQPAATESAAGEKEASGAAAQETAAADVAAAGESAAADAASAGETSAAGATAAAGDTAAAAVEVGFAWTREGYFTDDKDDLFSVMKGDDDSYPGWYVGCMIEEGIYGWYIPVVGETLHGSLVDPELGEEPFVVTVSEEGEDGLLFEIENGATYHLTPYEIPQAAFTVTVNTDGLGQIAYAEGEAEPEFDDEYPSQSAYVGLAEPTVYTFAAKPEEGWKFRKWTLNGSDYSKEEKITFEVSEDTELVAVFGIAGTDDTPVDLDKVTTLGELLGLPNYGTTYGEGQYIYAFEQDDNIYRATAELPKDVMDAISGLDFEDPHYDKKLCDLIAPLTVTGIENMTAQIPSQEELDAYVGKTGEDLLNDGWTCSGWNLEDMNFYMDHGPFSFTVTFEGAIVNPEDFQEENIKPLVVKAVTCDGVGDPAYIQE